MHDVPPIVHEVLRSPGQPLDAATRAFMEPRFGHDFSRVRVHTDTKAAESARAVSALAYTVGRDVVFGAEQYAPGTSVGQRLMAHELTHVVQQGNSNSTLQGKLMVGQVDDDYEREANRVAIGLLNESFSIQHSPITSGIRQGDRQFARLQRTVADCSVLTSSQFKGDSVLEDVCRGNRRLMWGDKGDFVKKVQQALLDAGIPLPEFGADGEYFAETARAVEAFKIREGISPSDAIVGRKTIAALDAVELSRPPTTGCKFNVRYGNERQEKLCVPTSCGGAIQFDILDITASGTTCPPSLAGMEVTEDVVSDKGCIKLPNKPVTGSFRLDARGRVPISGAVDTYGFCFPKRRVDELMLILRSCTQTMTQKVFVGGMLADTRTITFVVHFRPDLSAPDFFSCDASITRS